MSPLRPLWPTLVRNRDGKAAAAAGGRGVTSGRASESPCEGGRARESLLVAWSGNGMETQAGIRTRLASLPPERETTFPIIPWGRVRVCGGIAVECKQAGSCSFYRSTVALRLSKKGKRKQEALALSL